MQCSSVHWLLVRQLTPFAVCYLLCSCPPDIKDDDGNTPVDDARSAGNNDIVQFITTYKPQPKSEL